MQQKRFERKIAVVTGGNSGIGLATAKAFAAEGADVAITGRDEKTLQSALEEIGPKALGLKADVSRVAEIQAFFERVKERFGRVDALFVNAGIGKFAPFDQVSESFFNETLDINIKGAYFTIQKAVPLMVKGSAVVINGSVNAHMGMSAEQFKQTKDWIQSQVPLKRFGDPKEIAAAVLYLCSSESAFILGTELIIDGGMIQL